MPSALTYPGVYVEEIPSGVRTIAGVATSITAFIGRARRGRSAIPVRIQNFSDFEREFGGLWELSTLSYAVQQFFLNGGTDALIVRVHLNADRAPITLAGANGPTELLAASEGAWGNQLEATVDYDTRDPADASLYNLTIRELIPNTNPPQSRATEVFRNLSSDQNSPRFIRTVLESESMLVRAEGAIADGRPDAAASTAAATGDDGDPITDNEIRTIGIPALDRADLFNLLCIPPRDFENDIIDLTRNEAAAYCERRRAMFIADPPMNWATPAAAAAGVDALMTPTSYAAVFFPRIRVPDPLKENRLTTFAPCGAIAGIMARTDTQRGVWKAPAGIEAKIVGARELSYKMTDGENGILNPVAVNCLRTFAVYGHVVWGARTRDGADARASEWKYIPIRRLALFIEESLYRGTQWVVFEPNDEPLWAQIRLNIGAFMQNLFRQGAFQGTSPREAYFVKCDGETTTQTDRNLGIVNVLVGFAPLKPAEFVVIKIQQMAGQIAV